MPRSGGDYGPTYDGEVEIHASGVAKEEIVLPSNKGCHFQHDNADVVHPHPQAVHRG